MLSMRTNCERCDRALPADRDGAWICSFECTFCAVCTQADLKHRCPNCGGELLARPRRSPEMLVRYPAGIDAGGTASGGV